MKLQHDVPNDLLYKPGHYLYTIKNTFNTRVYVGITNHLNKRISDHTMGMLKGGNKRGGKSYIYSSGNKHGVDKFIFTLKSTHDSRDELSKAEVDLIAYYKSIDVPVYNLTLGGEGSLGAKRSPETRLKMSVAQKARFAKNPSHLAGTKHTEETKAKIRAGLLARNLLKS